MKLVTKEKIIPSNKKDRKHFIIRAFYKPSLIKGTHKLIVFITYDLESQRENSFFKDFESTSYDFDNETYSLNDNDFEGLDELDKNTQSLLKFGCGYIQKELNLEIESFYRVNDFQINLYTKEIM